MRRAKRKITPLLIAAIVCLMADTGLRGQSRNPELNNDERSSSTKQKNRGPARPITIPMAALGLVRLSRWRPPGPNPPSLRSP